MIEPSGTGPGVITDDGCAVDLYAQLPAMGEAEIMSGTLPAGAAILDLGCGTGRIAHRLIELGHPIVAVDQSAEMLAHVRDAETVRAPIAGLDLGRRFEGVLLASHLVNIPGLDDRRAVLSTAARHVDPDGMVVAEWHPPEWFDHTADGAVGMAGPVRIELSDVHRGGDLLGATVSYWAGDGLWTQTFSARRLSDSQLASELTAVGLRFGTFLTDDRTWFAARPPL
ncbi:MAG: class I SAM-dependent methyltransferase [Jatrophihabitantaceae bacterium]